MEFYSLTHAGEPRNLRLSTNEMFLKVDWDAPERGVTNDQIQGYVVACSFLEGNEAYTLEHRVSLDVLEAYLPIRNLSRSAYNCCVEAAFDTYSSKACIATPSQLNVDDSIQQRSICPSNQSIEAVAGALTSVIVILLIILLVAISALVYMWRRIVIQQSREEQSKT